MVVPTNIDTVPSADMVVMSKIEKKLELIAQLLAKAESTTPEEAEALTEHAERLMIRYGIEQALIDERRAKEGNAHEQIIEKEIIFSGTYALDLHMMGSSVVRSLGSLNAFRRSYKRTRQEGLMIVGFESDVNQALTLVASLELQAMVALRTFWASKRKELQEDGGVVWQYLSETEKRRMRVSFIHGFTAAVSARIKSNRNQAVAESGTGTELVLRSRKERVDEFMEAKNLPESRPRRLKLDYTYYDGVDAGENANTGEKAMTPGRTLGA
ncbi:DUF2786 domain-containing protein [Pseudarthrobacter sp. J1738]|uniref:DUF2786 domain-containing protein n=1 Tax=Pseudarthrobacter sp. J1738 TaxID=3420446 RepID=UPI003D26A842